MSTAATKAFYDFHVFTAIPEGPPSNCYGRPGAQPVSTLTTSNQATPGREEAPSTDGFQADPKSEEDCADRLAYLVPAALAPKWHETSMPVQFIGQLPRVEAHRVEHKKDSNHDNNDNNDNNNNNNTSTASNDPRQREALLAFRWAQLTEVDQAWKLTSEQVARLEDFGKECWKLLDMKVEDYASLSSLSFAPSTAAAATTAATAAATASPPTILVAPLRPCHDKTLERISPCSRDVLGAEVGDAIDWSLLREVRALPQEQKKSKKKESKKDKEEDAKEEAEDKEKEEAKEQPGKSAGSSDEHVSEVARHNLWQEALAKAELRRTDSSELAATASPAAQGPPTTATTTTATATATTTATTTTTAAAAAGEQQEQAAALLASTAPGEVVVATYSGQRFRLRRAYPQRAAGDEMIVVSDRKKALEQCGQEVPIPLLAFYGQRYSLRGLDPTQCIVEGSPGAVIKPLHCTGAYRCGRLSRSLVGFVEQQEEQEEHEMARPRLEEEKGEYKERQETTQEETEEKTRTKQEEDKEDTEEPPKEETVAPAASKGEEKEEDAPEPGAIVLLPTLLLPHPLRRLKSEISLMPALSKKLVRSVYLAQLREGLLQSASEVEQASAAANNNNDNNSDSNLAKFPLFQAETYGGSSSSTTSASERPTPISKASISTAAPGAERHALCLERLALDRLHVSKPSSRRAPLAWVELEWGLEVAFTTTGACEAYESGRLAWLGDAVLLFVAISTLLVARHGCREVEALKRRVKTAISNAHLSKKIQSTAWYSPALLSSGPFATKSSKQEFRGKVAKKGLADLAEALIGLAFLAQGLAGARHLISSLDILDLGPAKEGSAEEKMEDKQARHEKGDQEKEQEMESDNKTDGQDGGLEGGKGSTEETPCREALQYLGTSALSLHLSSTLMATKPHFGNDGLSEQRRATLTQLSQDVPDDFGQRMQDHVAAEMGRRKARRESRSDSGSGVGPPGAAKGAAKERREEARQEAKEQVSGRRETRQEETPAVPPELMEKKPEDEERESKRAIFEADLGQLCCLHCVPPEAEDLIALEPAWRVLADLWQHCSEELLQ